MNQEAMGATGVSTKIEYPIVDFWQRACPTRERPCPTPLATACAVAVANR